MTYTKHVLVSRMFCINQSRRSRQIDQSYIHFHYRLDSQTIEHLRVIHVTMLTCQYCTDPKQLKLFNFPHGHQHADSKRACADCWEGWLSAQVEEKPANQIRCIDDDCSAVITRAELDKLARKGTLDR